MRHSPDEAKSGQWGAASPRVRLWAVRLALLVACVGSVATEPPSVERMAEYEGPPLRLTPEQPALTRILVAHVSAAETGTLAVTLRLKTRFTVTWTPADPAHPAQPRLRVNMSPRNGSGSDADFIEDVVITESQQVVPLESDYLQYRINQAHEQPFTFTLELRPGAPPGTLEVAWKVMAEAATIGELESPENFTVQLTER